MADAHDLVAYLNAAPSPYHCVAESARRLEASGFRPLEEGGSLTLAPGERRYLARAGSLVAFVAGQEPPEQAGFRLIGAHTDSPNLRLKPRPQVHKEGYLCLGVEPYGGVLLATWADRDLGLSGRVWVDDAQGGHARLVRIDRPIARIPNLAIHLDRSVNDKGLVLDKQRHLPPVLAHTDGDKDALRTLLTQELGVEAGAILGWDLGFHDVQPAVVGGLRQEFIFGARLDNLASCWLALEALRELPDGQAATAVAVLFDHEEVGSQSDRGADSTWLAGLLTALAGGPEPLRRAMTKSFLVSSDMAHGVHPHRADLHEPEHKPMLNGGPVIKTNVNQRYATDGETGARFRRAAAAEGVPVQEFVTRSDLACGSTIGAMASAGLSVRTVDVGMAMWSMHSIREQCGANDLDGMARVLRRLLREG